MSHFVHYPPGVTTRVTIQILKPSLAEVTYHQGKYFLVVLPDWIRCHHYILTIPAPRRLMR